MLAGTGTTDDTLVGLDFANAPKQMVQDIHAFEAAADIGAAADAHLWARVLAINHKFSFVNFSRFPLEIFCTMANIGTAYESMTATTTPHDDMSAHDYKVLTIAGNLDANDKGVKGTWDVKFDMARLFPEQYELQPNIHGGDTVIEPSDSPWFACQVGNLPTYASCPPGQNTSYTPMDPNSARTIAVPSIGLRFYCKLQMPLDLGSASAGTAGSTGEIVDLRGFLLHLDMNWLVQYYRNRKQGAVHPGLKAYPDQDA